MDRDPKSGTADTLAAPATPDTPTLAATSMGVPPSWPTSGGPHDGTSLARYKLGAVLGRGGMGEVVSARDEQIGRSVAIKRMRGAEPTPEATARFLREARIQGRLDHPAVVPVHELSHDAAGQPFFVMKQLTGVTLADLIAAKTAPRTRLLRAFADVCLAIEFAHTRGVVHRDLKPANIVLGDFGDVYVLDWGIARVVGDNRESFSDVATLEDNATVAGSVIGTPGYMSPEQIRGVADLDGRSDVYALGCILFEILTGEPLHPRGAAALTTALTGLDAKPSARSPDIAPELDAICLAATMLAREDRFASARELGDAVQRFLDGDRDLALRKQLAVTELEAARAALAKGNRAEDRRDAIRAAARALALDPTARGPAELVGRLMIEPPEQVPPEVDRELEKIEDNEMKTQARLSSFGVVAYFTFFPLMYWAGYRDSWYLIAGPLLIVTLFVAARALARSASMTMAWVTFATNLVVIAVFCRALDPFLFGPGLAILAAMVYSMHPRFQPWWVVCASSIAAIVVPFAIALGAGQQATFVGGDIVLHTGTSHIDGGAVLIGLVVFVVAVVMTATLLSRILAVRRRDIQRTLQLQAWQLRQLVAD